MNNLVDGEAVARVLLEVNDLSQEQAVATLAQALVEIGGLNFDLLEDATNFIADGGE